MSVGNSTSLIGSYDSAGSFPLTSLPGFRALSLSSVTLTLLLVCLPPLHSVSRSILRPWVLFHVERGLEWVVLAQRHQHKLLTALCSTSCFTVSIAFYITFIPAVMWSGEVQLGTRLVSLMCLCECVGNGVKDLVCAPRPMGHPKGAGKTMLLLSEKAGAEDARVHSLEYGMPSSHTMHSLCLNFYTAHYLLTRGVIPRHLAFVVYGAAAVWVAWIGFCRVYMGMHTPIDIGGGAVIAIMVLSSYLTVDDRYETFVRHDKYFTLKQLTCSILFLKLHPLPIQHTPSYENSVIFAGVCWGIGLGLARHHASVDFFAASSLTSFPTYKATFIFWRRMIVGFALMVATRELSKALALRILAPLYQQVPIWLRRLWRPPIHTLNPDTPYSRLGIPVNAKGVPWDVLTTTKFVSYACLGYFASGGCFTLFERLKW